MPGFDRLVSLLKQYGVSAVTTPPSPKAPRAGELISGAPFDPLLAELYARCDGGAIGGLKLLGFDGKSDENILAWNEFIRKTWQDTAPRMLSCFQYGKELGEAHELATVPALASLEGAQPVVLIVDLMTLHIHPIGASVDKVFDLWARYVEPRLQRHGRLDEYMLGASTPDLVQCIDLIAEDSQLVEMMAAGRFDEVVGDDPYVHRWMQSVIEAARSR